MVNKVYDVKKPIKDRLSMRHSLMIWVAGAVLGWVVAVVSVWTALNTTADNNIAKNSPSTAEQMEHILPAAGGQKNMEKTKKKSIERTNPKK